MSHQFIIEYLKHTLTTTPKVNAVLLTLKHSTLPFNNISTVVTVFFYLYLDLCRKLSY